MATRGRGYSQSQEWDPMREDYDNSNFEQQYQEDEDSESAKDHRRLHITNIPKGLNDDGLRSAFAKYGTLVEVYVSKDPTKRYGLVSYETPAEAKLAMMKLDKTEPLKFNINIAYKKKIYDNTKRRPRNDEGSSRRERDRDDASSNGPRDRRERDDSSAVTSRYNNRREELANGDNNILADVGDIDDNMGLETSDPDIQLELERLQLEHLKLQQKQLVMKQKILMKQAAKRELVHSTTPSSRCVLPGGRIVVRQVGEGSDQHDGDSCFTTGAGDSSLPALQPVASHACIACGGVAAAFCARCGVAPYCSQKCQRKDWTERHRDVCHNLARTENADTSMLGIPPPPPQLRRPKSPARSEQRDDDNNSEKGRKKFIPPGYVEAFAQKPTQRQTPSNDRNSNDRRSSNNDRSCNDRRSSNNDHSSNDRRSSNNDRGVNDRSSNNDKRSNNDWSVNNDRGSNNDRSFNKGSSNNERNFNKGGSNDRQNRNAPRNNNASGRRPPLRHEQKNEQEEDWGPKKASNQEPSPVKPAQPAPAPVLESKPAPTKQEVRAPSVPLASVNDVTPVKKYVPKNYLIETLSIGDTVLVSVENNSSDCRIKAGVVCVSMHESAQSNYEALLGPLGDYCNTAGASKPQIGETFCYYESTEEAWYRARRLSPTLAALIDAGKVVSLAHDAKMTELTSEYANIAEFCCVLCSGNVKVGDSVKCTLLSKTQLGYKVSIANVDTDQGLGEGEISRWIPEVEWAKPVENAQAAIPEVSRPDIVSGSKVYIVHAEAPDRVIVRGSNPDQQTSFETALQLANGSGEPLKEPPKKGDTVVAKFTDGLKYRALVKRTNAKQKKYKVEYIDFGNTHIASLEDLYPCPAEISQQSLPTASTALRLAGSRAATEPALQVLLAMRDNDTEICVTSPSGSKTIPNGGDCILTVCKTNENLNKKIDEMSTPEWKKVEQRSGDVTEIQTVMFSELEYLELPGAGCELEILDFSMIHAKTLSGYQRGCAHAQYVFGELTDKMAEYCNSPIGKEPYMPKVEELCIAQCPPYPQWFRAVVVDCVAGQPARVCYLDYGNLETVDTGHMRRITRDFVSGQPALANTIEIQDFPDKPTEMQLAKALEYMQVNEEGRGVLKVTRCDKQCPGMYSVTAPGLIAAIMG